MGASAEPSSLLAHELQRLSRDGGRSIYNRSRADTAAMITTRSSRSGIVMMGSKKKCGRLIRTTKRRRRMINMNGIFEKRVRRLRTLVPKKRDEHDDDEEEEEEGLALAGLFGETAEYIMCLQMKVKLMQAMVNLLSSCDG
ncbi:uncharacterized protein LOC127797933 [Diospyros lotus]|uniref:uncharacterized protein LOC127797933 n=1 Tax=Diospyros lotus TaxID=55363 RepID=UPI0022595290|nr:uncharacterized protein LOC127797933 [Diospyros lotus]